MVTLGVAFGCDRYKARKARKAREAALLAEAETGMEMGMTTPTCKDIEAGVDEDLKLPQVCVKPWWKRSLLKGSATTSESDQRW